VTLTDFNNTRLSLLTFSSDICWKMCKKISIGQKWDNDFYKLYTLNRYIDVFLEYDPTRVEGENFFSVEDMLFIQEKINIMINTNYSLDFILV
jgi:hypothetical protein